MRVIVAGGGLGGLCLAQGLTKQGVEVAVYEAEPSLTHRRQGYRLHINAVGQTALRACLPQSLWELFVATCARPVPYFLVTDERLLRRFGIDLSKEGRGDATVRPNLIADRFTMRTILAAGLGDVVRFGQRFHHYELGPGDRVTAHFADGSRDVGDLLVGADGIGSVVRRQYLTQARVYDTRLRTIGGQVPLTDDVRAALPERVVGGLFTCAVGPSPAWVRKGRGVGRLAQLAISGAPHFHLALGPCQFTEPPEQAAARLAPELRLEPTRDYIMCTFGTRAERFPVPEASLAAMSGEELRQLALDMTTGADWHPALRLLFSNWDADSLSCWVIRSAVPIGAWTPSRVTLLGDAIHAMSPTGGTGANMAFRDASALVQAVLAIRNGAPLPVAIREYEQGMRKEGFAALRQSARRGVRLLGHDRVPRADGPPAHTHAGAGA